MYGKGKSTEHPDQAAAWMKEINANMDQWLKRATAGLEVLKKQPRVDTSRMAAIGYCLQGRHGSGAGLWGRISKGWSVSTVS